MKPETTDWREEELRSPSPLEHLSQLLPVEDLSAPDARLRPAFVRTPATEAAHMRLGRYLCRSQSPHVILTGPEGVGKESLVRQLAAASIQSEAHFLEGWRFLWVDCRNVGPEDSRACLESIFAAIRTIPRVILCLQGLRALLTRPNGGTNKPLLRAMISRNDLRMIGVMTDWEYTELIASDSAMRRGFQRLELEEPNDEVTVRILQEHARTLSQTDQLDIRDSLVERTVALTSTFMLGESHPGKAVRVLRQVCDDVRYRREVCGEARQRLELADLEAVISEETGIPIGAIAGDRERLDVGTVLQESVVGQPAAVEEVANELRLIKAGLTEPGKPAGVFLFAGMTGVGKTELAKRMAELYSTTKRLQTYAMGNYTEPHSVSGIIGVPPGYVGHEDGGRLVNELNADPYSVFLLDEAEKCHPNIWKPFLNLFDEGWLIDQRGTKAYADRAIFILTTNAGDRNIAQMTKSGKPPEEITEQVKQALSRVRHERSSQPVFPPQFLSRIRRIIVFQPLDEAAMVGITRRVCERMSRLWRQKRERTLHVTDEVLEAIGRRAHVLNEACHGQEGGRLVKKLVSDIIERSVQDAAMKQGERYARSPLISVSLERVDESGRPQVGVSFLDGER